IATGYESVTPTGRMTSRTITFPDGMFDSEPVMAVNGWTSVPGNTLKKVSYSGASRTGATLWLDRTNNQNTSISWMAMEPGGGVAHQGWRKPQYDGASNTTARPTRYLNSLQTAVRAGLVRMD